MAFTAAIGFGGKLEIDGAYPSTPNWVEVAAIQEFGINVDVGEADTTHKQSQASAPWWADFLPGKVSVEATFRCLFDAAAAQHGSSILGHIGVVRQYRYTFTDGSVWSFVGFYKTPAVTVPMEEANAADVTLRVKGAPTFTGYTPA